MKQKLKLLLAYFRAFKTESFTSYISFDFNDYKSFGAWDESFITQGGKVVKLPTKLQEIFQKLKQPFPKYVFPDKGPYKGYVQFDLYNVDTKKIPKFLDWIKFTNENLKTTFQIYSDDNIQIKKIAEKSAAEKALQFLDKTYNITWSSKI